MTPKELRRFARAGAAGRIAEIQRELENIYRLFPELRTGRSASNPHTAGVRRAVAGVRRAVEGAVTRRRPKMSAEARKRIAEAQRKRWAEWKAQQDKAGKGNPSAQPSAGGSRKRR